MGKAQNGQIDCLSATGSGGNSARPDGGNQVPVLDLDAACAQSLSTGIAGALVLVSGVVFFVLAKLLGITIPFVEYRYAILGVVIFAVMAAIEIGRFKVHKRQFDFHTRKRLEPADHFLVLHRFEALLISLLLAWFAYALFREYGLRVNGWQSLLNQSSWYRPFFSIFALSTAGIVILSVPYLYVCALHGRWGEEDDDLLVLYKGYEDLFSFRLPGEDFKRVFCGMLVKFYFVPIMVVYFLHNGLDFENALTGLLGHKWSAGVVTSRKIFQCFNSGLFLVDTGLAVLGYIFCFRMLDTHIRSAETTLYGWLVALACYPPFYSKVTTLYASCNDGAWDNAFSSYPLLFNIVGVVVVVLLGCYAYATIAFGLRFSNLTHRGILCRGPYAVVRHPAYAAKNIAWWLMCVPFLSGPGDCARLLLINLIYFLRAITEERHLSRDPVYREYMKRVKYRFIPGVF